MKLFSTKSKILFISTFPPRKCGIASFTNDLVRALNLELKKDFEINICALDKKRNTGQYTAPVSMVMDGNDLDSCVETAGLINRDPRIEMICIEHEFGLYGGNMGDYLLGFLSLIEKPFVIRFHTVLPDPDPKRLQIVRSLALLADKIIVMTHHSAALLAGDYDIAVQKIMIIPHGTHLIENVDPEELKSKYKLGGKLIFTTFGLLSPNKGIETGISAMADIIKSFPKARYLVLGRTHPNLLVSEGEAYRESLQKMIVEKGLTDNIELINEYLPTRELMEYLVLTDIYLFTSRDPNQAMSGTFLYAMSAGCAIISNSFVLAEEMLEDQAGIIIPSGDEKALAKNAVYLLQNETVRKEMGHKAFLKTRNTVWKNVAHKHAGLFYKILNEPVAPVRRLPDAAII